MQSSDCRQTSIDITFTDGTDWSTVEAVMREIVRTFDVEIRYFDNAVGLGRFTATLEGPIAPEEVSRLYGEEISEEARASIASMHVGPVDLSSIQRHDHPDLRERSYIRITFTDEIDWSTGQNMMHVIWYSLCAKIRFFEVVDGRFTAYFDKEETPSMTFFSYGLKRGSDWDRVRASIKWIHVCPIQTAPYGLLRPWYYEPASWDELWPNGLWTSTSVRQWFIQSSWGGKLYRQTPEWVEVQ